MQFGGRYIIGASRQNVWSALNDTTILKACLPGCEHIEWAGPTGLEARIGVNLGVVRPVFSGDLVLSNVVPAVSYTLTGQGRGGLLGRVQASADISLSDQGCETLLDFVATGGGSGRIMKLGRSLIGDSAQKVIDGFFERFGTAMGAPVRALAPPQSPPFAR